jgi:hypothetical protein
MVFVNRASSRNAQIELLQALLDQQKRQMRCAVSVKLMSLRKKRLLRLRRERKTMTILSVWSLNGN